MKHSNKTFPKALKEIMDKKDIIHRKLAAKTNFSFSYFCILKKRKKHPPIETIKKIASGLGIPPEYFLEYRIDKLIKLLMDNPTVTDYVFEFAKDLVDNDNLKVADKEQELLKYYPGTAKAT
jgi:transcriptional regulator with XRE-family HTH domain